MKIQSNNAQFQNNKNTTTFKGAAERKIFEEAVDFLDLQKVLKKATPENNGTPVKEYFSEVFKNLAKKFSMIYEDCDVDSEKISILKDDELVQIRKVNSQNIFRIEYAEYKDLDELTYKGERTLLCYLNKDCENTIHRHRSQFIRNSKDNAFVESGISDFIKKDSNNFEGRKLYLDESEAIDPSWN